MNRARIPFFAGAADGATYLFNGGLEVKRLKHSPRKVSRSVLAPACLFVMAGAACGAALGTAWTYQGRLDEAGAPVTGVRNLTFILYDSEIGGSQQGATVGPVAVAVDDGIFTTQLDFGVAPIKAVVALVMRVVCRFQGAHVVTE